MIIDTNLYLSRWPTRRLPYDQTPELVALLKRRGITEAWTGSFDALLHRDLSQVNRTIARTCHEQGKGLLRPVGAVNPRLPGWKEDLRLCAEDLRMHAIRLHPNYHGYELADPRFQELLDLAAQHKLLVQIVARMEDPRTQHPLLRGDDLDVTPLPQLARSHPNVNVMVLNALRSTPKAVLAELATCENVAIEIAMLEGIAGIERLLESFPHSRLMFGSYAPFFVLESALGKLDESELGATIRTAIESGNARHWAPKDKPTKPD